LNKGGKRVGPRAARIALFKHALRKFARFACFCRFAASFVEDRRRADGRPDDRVEVDVFESRLDPPHGPVDHPWR